jgi:hypothetical protein
VTDEIERRFRQRGECRWILEVLDLGVALEVDRVRRDRFGALRGELTVRCELAGARTVEGVLYSADFNLSDGRARLDVGRVINQRARAPRVDWAWLLEEMCLRVRESERVGKPAVLLRDLPKPSPDDMLDVDGLRLPKRHPAIVFGDGGAAKSYLALFIAGRLAQRDLRVAVFDWELGGEDHRDRLERLFGNEMPPVRYVRCNRALVHEVDHLSRIAHDEELDYAIYDSVAFACDGPPEAAEIAGHYFRAVRSIGVGSLHIAHVSKAENADQRPFGSAFWHNGARATWFAKLADAAPGSEFITVGLFQRKSNLGALQPAVGFRVSFGKERTEVKRTDLSAVEGLAHRLTLIERMTGVLRAGARSIPELASELDAKTDSIIKTVSRWEKSGRLVRFPGPNGVVVVGLGDGRRAS